MRLRAKRFAHLRDSPLELTVPRLAEAGGWTGVFGLGRPLSLEIGLGKDPHVVARASQDPGGAYVGLEYSRKKLDCVLSKAHERGVENLRVIRADARQILEPLFADGSLREVYIFFPDPWPKKRHRKKRIVQPDVARLLARKLAPGGVLELRTDDADYRAQMIEVLEQEPAFVNLSGAAAGYRETPEDPAAHIPTLFEQKFRAAGRPVYYLRFGRRDERAAAANGS